MEIAFSKYHGIGNDFVMIADPDDRLKLDADTVRALCDRRFGIGGDGVIRVAPGTEGGDFFMDYINSDGSIGEMCGNGIRCLAVFVRDEGLTEATEMQIDTRAGRKVVTVLDDGRVRVDMGAPIFEPSEIPAKAEGEHALRATIDLDDQKIDAALVSMGNPHAVIFVSDPAHAPVTKLGPKIETHPMFPNGTNVEFLRVEGPEHVTMRVWERGSGETLACGTGAAAVGVVARLLGDAHEKLTVALPGGDLEIEWSGSLQERQPVYLTGPAVRSFAGHTEI
ncbi:MAG: diaminopimelate epimerase [Actinomycetota bacterium]